MIIDTHCHLSFDEFNDDREAVINRAHDAGIKAFINICTKKNEVDKVIGLADTYDNVFASAGIHPHEAEETLKASTLVELEEWLIKKSQHPRVVLIGETGLDYYYEHSPKEIQQQVFRMHVAVSQKLNIPLSIHTRDAESDTIMILQEMSQIQPVSGIIHCFTGTAWLATEALRLGMYISISGIITFNKSVELQEIIKTIPLDRLLVETDAPYLAPAPYRGKRNEPSYIIKTVEKIAALKEVSVEEVIQSTTDNFKRLNSRYSDLN